MRWPKASLLAEITLKIKIFVIFCSGIAHHIVNCGLRMLWASHCNDYIGTLSCVLFTVILLQNKPSLEDVAYSLETRRVMRSLHAQGIVWCGHWNCFINMYNVSDNASITPWWAGWNYSETRGTMTDNLPSQPTYTWAEEGRRMQHNDADKMPYQNKSHLLKKLNGTVITRVVCAVVQIFRPCRWYDLIPNFP